MIQVKGFFKEVNLSHMPFLRILLQSKTCKHTFSSSLDLPFKLYICFLSIVQLIPALGNDIYTSTESYFGQGVFNAPSFQISIPSVVQHPRDTSLAPKVRWSDCLFGL